MRLTDHLNVFFLVSPLGGRRRPGRSSHPPTLTECFSPALPLIASQSITRNAVFPKAAAEGPTINGPSELARSLFKDGD